MNKKNNLRTAQSGSASAPARGTAVTAAADALAAELRPGQSIELLKELHILTREGRLNQDSRRKLKQVYHLFQFIEPLLQELSQEGHAPTLADHGAGKSYLGFILYDLYFKALGRGHIYGIEWRADLVEKSRTLAARLGFDRMAFLNLSVAESTEAAALPERIDMVTALHACDTATDDAIAFGLQKKARAMVIVPCCQAEVAAFLRQGKALQLARTPLAELWRHPVHTRELGSQITNVLRCLHLEASGYQVTVTELVGWEHSMKNELIIARHTGQKKRSAQERLRAILQEFGLEQGMGPRFGLESAGCHPYPGAAWADLERVPAALVQQADWLLCQADPDAKKPQAVQKRVPRVFCPKIPRFCELQWVAKCAFF